MHGFYSRSHEWCTTRGLSWKPQLTARNLQDSRVDIDFCGFDDVHLLGEGATHLPAPCSPRHAAQANPRDSYGYRCGLPLQGAAQPEAGPVRAVQGRAGALGAAALTLAWHADHGTGKRVQLRFPGLFSESVTSRGRSFTRKVKCSHSGSYGYRFLCLVVRAPTCATLASGAPASCSVLS